MCTQPNLVGGNMPSHSAKYIYPVLIMWMMTAQMWSQGGATGAITGTVQDPSGAVVANAEVRIINQETGNVTRTVKTDANGAFDAPLMPVRTYTVAVTIAGFQYYKFSGVAQHSSV